MKKTEYRDKARNIIGYTETSATGVVTARDKSREKLGHYDPKTNKTYKGTKFVGYGNLVTNFFTEL
jgi:hypothetical protein